MNVVDLKNIIIEEIELDSVSYYGKEKYNSNNHWLNDVKPKDYNKILEQCNTSNWIDFFHPSYIVINIFQKDIKWMKEATQTGLITRKFSSLHEEEKDDLIKKYKFVEKYFVGQKYFIRTENVSLKHGIHGTGPYKDFNSIIESLCTCKQGHTPIEKDTTRIKLFLLPWLDFEYMNEYRVFVYRNKITAISQQHLYEKNSIFNGLDKDELNKKINDYVKIITTYFEEKIKKNITYMDSYTYDFAILPGNNPYLIEINCFGKEYAAGSALFHWIIDEDKLYNQEDKIYFRYTI